MKLDNIDSSCTPSPRWCLPTIFFFLGVFSIVAQTTIIREFLVVVYGSEFIMGMLFFHWLIGIFLGALGGARITRTCRHPGHWFVLAVIIMCLLLPICITGVRCLYSLSGTTAGAYPSFFQVFLFSTILVTPLGFFIGSAFPLAASLQNKDDHNSNLKHISHIYIFEALGFLVGGILYTFWLVGRMNSFFIASGVALPLVLSCFALPSTPQVQVTQPKQATGKATSPGANDEIDRAGPPKLRKKQAKPFRFTITAPVVTAILFLLFFLSPLHRLVDRVTAGIRWQGFSPVPQVYACESKYQQITLAKQYDQYFLYLNSGFVAVFPGEDNRILAAHLLCQHPNPRRVLVIGNALTGLGKELLAYNLEQVVSLEIDPMVTTTILKFLPGADKKILEDSRFQVLTGDGRRFVKHPSSFLPNPPVFDLVYLDVPEPASLLANRFYTQEFFQDLAEFLPQDGVLALKLTSSENFAGGVISTYTSSIYQTLATVFPVIAVAPGSENFLFATRREGVVSDDPALLESRYNKRKDEPGNLGLIFYSLYPGEKTKYITSVLSSPGKKDKTSKKGKTSTLQKINRDEVPSAVLHFNKILGWYSGSNLAGILGFLQVLDPLYLFLLLVIFFVLAAWLGFRRRQQPGVSLYQVPVQIAVFACGMAGLTLELVLLYIFQVVFGYMYHMIGMLIALFMAGLPLGAHLATVRIEHIKKKNASKLQGTITNPILGTMMILLTSMAILTLSIFPVHSFFATSSALGSLLTLMIIFLLAIFIGSAVGMMFPLALQLTLEQGESPGKAAGKLSAIDHLGGATGALFLGTLLLPLLGISTICLFTAVFLGFSSLLLFIAREKHQPNTAPQKAKKNRK